MILHMCSARIYGPGKTFRGSPCSKPAKVERDGKHYCTLHDPERVNARRAAKRARQQARVAERRAARDAEQARNNEIVRRAECYPELLAALQWMVDNDDTNEGDEPLPDHGGLTWNEINSLFIAGLNKARAAIAKATGAQA